MAGHISIQNMQSLARAVECLLVEYHNLDQKLMVCEEKANGLRRANIKLQKRLTRLEKAQRPVMAFNNCAISNFNPSFQQIEEIEKTPPRPVTVVEDKKSVRADVLMVPDVDRSMKSTGSFFKLLFLVYFISMIIGSALTYVVTIPMTNPFDNRLPDQFSILTDSLFALTCFFGHKIRQWSSSRLPWLALMLPKYLSAAASMVLSTALYAI